MHDTVCSLFETVASNLDRGNFTISVSLDLAKAFDSIDCSILINKLELYGVRGKSLTFLRNYFPDRLQYTSLGNTNSEVLPVNFGNVQGSTLGTLMFLVYINELIWSSLKIKFNLYADDTAD